MRVLVVVQRYGTEIIGGAESHARALAEALVAKKKWDVTIATTMAQSYQTWKNTLRQKDELINGVRVLRFPTVFPRLPFFNFFSRAVLKLRRICKRQEKIAYFLERLWMVGQGPFCPALNRFIKTKSEYNLYIFFTYLYYPTAVGIFSAPADKTILIPTAHDEFAFYFRHTQDVLNHSKLIFANSTSEKSLMARVYPEVENKTHIVGIGIDTDTLTPSEEKRHDILYLGRISRGKNIDQLLSWFSAANLPYTLSLAGVIESDIVLPQDPKIRYLGILSEQEKNFAVRQARLVINPSPLESLSLVVLEAASAGVPIVLNQNCEIFRYYEKILPTVKTYHDIHSFKAAVEAQMSFDWSASAARTSLAFSRKWVEDHYSWNSVLAHFSQA